MGKRNLKREIARLFARQHSLITRRQALRAGMTPEEIRRELREGRWIRVRPGLYRLAGTKSSKEADLLGACLVTSGWASHEWAAWLWKLGPLPDTAPSVAVPRTARGRTAGVNVHRCSERRYARPPTYRDVPCTDRLTTVVDYASVTTAERVDEAIDTGLARGYFTVGSLLGELDRGVAARRRGAGAVRASLLRRGVMGAPRPSVLESRVLRLLASEGIVPLGAEEPVWASDHHYRIDFVLAPGLALEVDGYVYHATPGRHSGDHRRRNEMLNTGWHFLVYTWQDITEDAERVLEEVRTALANASRR